MVENSLGIPEGWGLPLLPQNGKSEGVGESYMKFPPWWGYGYFLELHNDNDELPISFFFNILR